MMGKMQLDLTEKAMVGEVFLPLSKSLCNRALVLQAQFPSLKIEALSQSDDSQILAQALSSNLDEINLGAAGTAMRFATAFFATTPNRKVVLTGSERMLQRPIGNLVDALRALGAEIIYVGEVGFPPLQIVGKTLQGGQVCIHANMSSQFASALLLVAPRMQKGLKISFSGEVVSQSYINMTLGLLRELGVETAQSEAEIHVAHTKNLPIKKYAVEADWSAAAYWFGFVALAENAKIFLPGLKENALQGDVRLVKIFEELGVKSSFNEEGLLLEKRASQKMAKLIINLQNNPDLAQPLAVVCAALGIGADFRGLQTLKIKETDRLVALKVELAKVGVDVNTTESSLSFEATKIHPPTVPFKTYEDHRMAMSFALLATQFSIEIENPEVVSKSYPDFFLEIIGVIS